MHSFAAEKAALLRSMGHIPDCSPTAIPRDAVMAAWRRFAENTVHEPFLLDLTNSISVENTGPAPDGTRALKLSVHVQDPIAANEIANSRGLVDSAFRSAIGIAVSSVSVSVSSEELKKRHPFVTEADETPTYSDEAAPRPLTAKERAYMQAVAGRLKNPRLARAFSAAMTKDLEWKNGIKERDRLLAAQAGEREAPVRFERKRDAG